MPCWLAEKYERKCSLMKLVTDRTGQISQYLRPYMEECFRISCGVLQAEIDTHAGGIWQELERDIKKCLDRAASMQKQNKKGSLGYLVFSFLRYGEYGNGPELRIDAMDDGFYLDKQETAAHYHPEFLWDRYVGDIELLYKKAGEKFIRLQNYELDEVKKEYTDSYYAVLYRMLESLAGLVMETVADSGIPITEDFKIVFGEYMGNGTVLYKRGGSDEVLSD